jgi:hypothetical protein
MIGYIYQLLSGETSVIYIGSTTQQLSSRMAGHRRDARNKKNGKNTFGERTAFALTQFNDCVIECLEIVDFTDKQELYMKEGEWIRKSDNCVNVRIAGRTLQQCINEKTDEEKKKIKNYKANWMRHKRNTCV